MSINLYEWKDYERSHRYVKAAKYHVGQGSWFGLSKRTPSLVVSGFKIIIKSGAVVPEDIDYIKSIVGLDDSARDIH